ncbi:MAG TPA: hypothetical protein VG964_04380 [Candidatus Saccharimonadales bacterium]|nr:hypothetical protein [Candidatus Saccharimonadales bacterium]
MMFDRKPVNNSIDEPTISSDTTPSMYERVRNEPWFSWAIRIVVAIIVIVVLVFGGRWLHHKLQHKTNSQGATTAGQTERPNFNNQSGAKSNGSSSSNKSDKSGSKSSSGTAAGPGLKSGNNQQLANTGPGDVVAIFLATSFAVAMLHYAYETNKNS